MSYTMPSCLTKIKYKQKNYSGWKRWMQNEGHEMWIKDMGMNEGHEFV